MKKKKKEKEMKISVNSFLYKREKDLKLLGA